MATNGALERGCGGGKAVASRRGPGQEAAVAGRAGRRKGPDPDADANASAGDERKVFCGNLSWTLTDEELRAHMSTAGNVVACSIGYYPDGRSKVRRRPRRWIPSPGPQDFSQTDTAYLLPSMLWWPHLARAQGWGCVRPPRGLAHLSAAPAHRPWPPARAAS